MAERCLMAASLAVLVFHPSSTIKCFKPKSSTTSPQREKPSPSDVKKVPSKSKKKQGLDANPSLSTNSSRSNALKTGRLSNMVSELVEGGVVETIFRSGWTCDMGLKIEKVLKVNHGADVLERFEEYREMVKSKAIGKRMERVLVDGDEHLRFLGAVITCPLGYDGVSNICDKKCCGVCRVIDSNVNSMKAGSSPLCKKSWRAHEKVSNECLINGVSVSARKAIILCRVIAGRVARSHKCGLVDGEEGAFDSVVRLIGDQENSSEELIVFNPSAVLPCFVVIYSVP